jgi:nucleotide-binding universal stress UspA family protein
MKKTLVKKPQKILCYIDYSKHSPYIVEYAYQLSKLIDAELFILHTVTDIKNAAGFYVPHINTDKLEEELIQAARNKMYAICNQAVGDKIDAKHRLVSRGNPVDVIVDEIKGRGIELLVLAHDLTPGALHEWRGDFVEKFMKQSLIPFLVVPVK